MSIIENLDSLSSIPPGSAVSIGNFDGVHLGHQAIIRTLISTGLSTTIVTFEPHPLSVLRPELAPPRLTSEAAKLRRLKELGVDHVVLLRPEPSVLNLSAREFYDRIRTGLKPGVMAEGKDFYFGKSRSGTTQVLRQWCEQDAIDLRIVQDAVVRLPGKQQVEVSSSLVRWLLLQGRTREANACLGSPYRIEGKVVRGNARGRTIGFPTANLDCGDQLIPADGVYAASCTVTGNPHAVALSIGSAPTFGGSARQVEAHLIDFSGDLYGQTLAIDVGDWVRGQMKFCSAPQLIEQLDRDVKAICNLDAAIKQIV